MNHTKSGLPAAPRKDQTRRDSRRALFFLLPLLAWSVASAYAAGDPDLPGATPNFELIPAGSLVIPMDNNLQSLPGAPFNMKSYGLVNSLLHTNIPVKWAIAVGKAKDGIDFTANVERLFPTALAATNRSFLAGPFIVHRDFTNNAMSVIAAYGNNVAVYRLTTNAMVDIRYTVAHKPHVAVLDDGGTDGIHTGILDEAGFPTDDYTVLHAADVEFLPLQSCYTIVTSPHFDGGITATNQTHSIRDFVMDGGNFLAQCAGVRTYENNTLYGHFHSTLGFQDNNSATTFNYPNPDIAFNQFQGVLADEGGSLQDWTLAAGSVLTNNAYAEVLKSGTTNVFRAGVSKLIQNKPGSVVFYLGGHNYSGNPLSDYNGRRMYMNAVFVPPDRPPDCVINFQTELAITKDDGVTTVTNNQVVTYQIVVTNVGPGRVVGAPVTDNFPSSLTNVTWTSVGTGGGTAAISSGTGNIDTTVNLPIHASVTFIAQAVVTATAPGVVSNSASVAVPPGMIDLNPDSNQATDVNRIVERPIANNDTYSVNEDTLLAVGAPGVLANDMNPDGDSMSAVLVNGPTHGTLALNADGSFTYTPEANYNGSDSFSAVLVSGPEHGTLALNANGSFSYSPTANYNGTDSFSYRANDGQLDSGVATVTITINPVNDAPVAVNDSYTTAEDTTLTVGAPGVLANDSDVDGDNLTAVLVMGPSHGSLALNADGSFSYIPAANYNGPDSFSYKANDGAADSGVVVVTISVTPVNDAPVAANDSYTTAEDTALTVSAPGVLANDGDVDGDSLSAVLVSGPEHGTVALNADGSFTYTPTNNYNGPDSFSYKANDGTVDSGVATVAITVEAVNDAPVANEDSYNVNEDTTLTVDAPGVLGNDTDVEGDNLNVEVVSEPEHGTLTLSTNGGFIYMPETNYNGTDSFTYQANDGSTK